MKADWDDAPDHIKRKKKLPIGIAGVTAACLIGGILFMADRNGWVEYARNLANPPQPASQTATSSSAETRYSPTTPTPEDTFWEQVGNERQQPSVANTNSAVRQTSFNDSNYRPRTDINTIQGPRASASMQKQITPQGLNGRSKTITVRWRDARGRTTRWQTSFTYQNSRIDNNSFCRNYRAGSIDYRTCRKGAKEWLKERCLSNNNGVTTEWRRMYCHAESSFRH